jgi:hypothetical protein
MLGEVIRAFANHAVEGAAVAVVVVCLLVPTRTRRNLFPTIPYPKLKP